ncbi:hypothetical protein FF47_54 [Mycobacterium phage FF47]|uniref:Uncharacterized protein n=1 Tax=Mycobacterium phage FF47 TaxID=1305710 RepID=M4W6S8_9CAUD|nr:hypothetical protein FF47_54 [Mycobacterium phage FF47]AGI12326.1 hypothetical protein FF47_54 [Mycobacterium phage FF47]UNY41909.1 hypothetical protein [Mycobacterium phage Maco6]WKV22131.1 hypothetical protein 8UZL_00013 [Mycobacteroides phage 8UZL]
MSQNRNSTRDSRRRKRLAKRNGDRQFFKQVELIRRRKLQEWQKEHDPQRLARRIAQQALFAAKRDAKQMLRDAARKKETQDA